MQTVRHDHECAAAAGESVGKPGARGFAVRRCQFASRLLWCVGLALFGCSGADESSDDSVAIEDRPLGGVVGGEPWTLARAETNAFLSEGEPDYWVDLYATPGTPCETSSLDSGHHLIVQAPREPGDYPLSLRRNVTFVIEGDTFDNLIATTGRLVIDEVSASSIRGGAYLRFNGDNTVNGRFEATICP